MKAASQTERVQIQRQKDVQNRNNLISFISISIESGLSEKGESKILPSVMKNEQSGTLDKRGNHFT